MKPFSEDHRPNDWFSQKNCALQYNLLLEQVDTPRRKRGGDRSATGSSSDAVETPGEAIVKRLTSDRIRELKDQIEKDAAEIKNLELEVDLLSNEELTDEQLDEIQAKIDEEERLENEKKAAHQQWLNEREEKKLAIQAALKMHSSKLPLKGAAAAAQMAGAARRASSQSEASSGLSDVDSPAPPTMTTMFSSPKPAEPKPDPDDVTPAASATTTPAATPIKAGTETTSPLLSSLLQSPAQTAAAATTSSETEVKDVKVEEAESKLEEKDEADEAMDVEVATKPEEEVSIKAEVEDDDSKNETFAKPEEEVKDETATKSDIMKKPSRPAETKPGSANQTRTSRSKRTSEVSEDDAESDDKTPTAPPTRSSRRTKRISERSNEEDESSNDSKASGRLRSNKKVSECEKDDDEDQPPPAVENRRVSRLRDAEKPSRKSTGNASRSNSPLGTGDESEGEQKTPRSTRQRRKSGKLGHQADAVESNPPSPTASVGSSFEEGSVPEKTLERRKHMYQVLDEIKEHKAASKVFAGDLQQGVFQPMDLAKIRQGVDNGTIKNAVEFQRNITLMFLNVIMYSPSTSEVFPAVFPPLSLRRLDSLLYFYRFTCKRKRCIKSSVATLPL